jgi:hypothetical protein
MAVAKKGGAAAYKQKRETVFKLKKETSGAVQYEEVNENGSKKTDMDGAVMGSMYLRKATLKGELPQVIKITAEW